MEAGQNIPGPSGTVDSALLTSSFPSCMMLLLTFSEWKSILKALKDKLSTLHPHVPVSSAWKGSWGSGLCVWQIQHVNGHGPEAPGPIPGCQHLTCDGSPWTTSSHMHGRETSWCLRTASLWFKVVHMSSISISRLPWFVCNVEWGESRYDCLEVLVVKLLIEFHIIWKRKMFLFFPLNNNQMKICTSVTRPSHRGLITHISSKTEKKKTHPGMCSKDRILNKLTFSFYFS